MREGESRPGEGATGGFCSLEEDTLLGGEVPLGSRKEIKSTFKEKKKFSLKQSFLLEFKAFIRFRV